MSLFSVSLSGRVVDVGSFKNLSLIKILAIVLMFTLNAFLGEGF